MGTDESRPDEPISSSEPLFPTEEDERPYALAADGYDEDPLAPEVAKAPLIGVRRHLASLVLALLAVAGAVVVLDYGIDRWGTQIPGFSRTADVDARAVSAIVVAAFLLFLAAWICRVSPLGPLVAGLVLGVAPWIAVTFYPGDVSSIVVDLPQVYDGIGVASSMYGQLSFVLIGALLVGSAFGASWRDR